MLDDKTCRSVSRFAISVWSRRWFFALLPLVVFVGALGAEAKLIGDVSGVVQGSPVVSPDGAHVAAVVLDAKTQSRHVVVDGEKLGGDYDSIAVGTPLFSPNGQHVAFVAQKGKNCIVVLDGVEVRSAPIVGKGWPVADLVFSPDGQALACKLRTGGKTVLAIDGKWTWRSRPYDDATGPGHRPIWGVWDFQFEPHGYGFLFRGKVGQKMVATVGPSYAGNRTGAIAVLHSPPHDSIGRGTPVWLSNRRTRPGEPAIGYIAVDQKQERIELLPPNAKGPAREKRAKRARRDAPQPKHEYDTWDAIARGSLVRRPGPIDRLDYIARKGEKWMAVLSGEPGPAFDEIGALLYSPDGKRHAYAARSGPKVCLVVDGRGGPFFEGVRYPGTVFSPDGKTVVYAARTAAGSVLMVNGKQVAAHDHIDAGSITFTPDGKHLAYAAGANGKHFVVLDQKAGPAFDEVSALRLGDGGRLAYRARRGLKVYVVVNTTVSEPYDQIAPGSPVISPDGRRVAWAAMKRAVWTVVVDGKAGPPCEGVVSTIAFSPTSKHVAYVGKFVEKGQTAYAVVLDQQAGSRYASVWMRDGGRLTFRPDDTLLCFARNSALIYRIALGPDIPSPELYLSDFSPTAPRAGRAGSASLNRSAAGGALSISGQRFDRGIGVKAPTELVYDLPGIFGPTDPRKAKKYMEWILRHKAKARAKKRTRKETPIRPVSLVAIAGVDDGAAPDAGVVFQVWADGKKLAESPLLHRGEFHGFRVPLPPDARRLSLVATAGPGTAAPAPADWCHVGFVFQED